MTDWKQVRLSLGDASSEAKALIQSDGTLALPLSALAAQFGYTCDWDEASQTVRLKPGAGEKSKTGFDAAEERLLALVTAKEARLAEIALAIFRQPERGNEEKAASQLLAEELRQNGFQVELGLPGVRPLTDEKVFLDTAFKAIYEGQPGGPTIAIMLEYDALPMGHACGHNLIVISGLGAALALREALADQPGRLWVMGTPAEEGGPKGGKIPLLAAGHFDGADLTLITHPGDRWDTGSDFLAVSGATLTYTGVPSHAAAAPERGISALDAALITYNAIETIREHMRADARIHGIITNGGQASNIVPEKAELKYGVRALDQAYIEVLKTKVENCARAGALATGAKVDITWTYGLAAPINVAALDTLVLEQAKRLGAGPCAKWESLGSSDLGNVGFEIPTCNLWFAISPAGVLPHTHEFMAAAVSDAGIAAAVQAAQAVALSAWALYRDPAKVAAIQAEFAASKAKFGNP